MPHALESKYPQVGQSWQWFWLFPSPTLSIYTHVLKVAAGGTASPLDALAAVTLPAVQPPSTCREPALLACG